MIDPDMFGPEVVARTLTRCSVGDSYGNRWQYHSRSDRHARVAACGMLLDLLQTSEHLRMQARAGRVALGTKFTMRDVTHDKQKDLDLVITTASDPPGQGTLLDVCRHFDVDLDARAGAVASALPSLRIGPVERVLVAFEVKAAMTAHVRALTRLFSEISTSHEVIHAAAPEALAVGLVLVNTATHFTSPDRNRHSLELLAPTVTRHKQPTDAQRVFERMRQVPRRGGEASRGYDAFATFGLRCRNDGSPVEVDTAPPAPPIGDAFEYSTMMASLARAYDTRWSAV